MVGSVNHVLDTHFHHYERALDDPPTHFNADPLDQIGRVNDKRSLPQSLSLAVLPQPRGQVHRDVAHFYRYSNLHYTSITSIGPFEGMADRVFPADQGPSHIAHYYARINISELQRVLLVVGFSEHYDVHESGHGYSIHSSGLSKLEEHQKVD